MLTPANGAMNEIHGRINNEDGPGATRNGSLGSVFGAHGAGVSEFSLILPLIYR